MLTCLHLRMTCITWHKNDCNARTNARTSFLLLSFLATCCNTIITTSTFYKDIYFVVKMDKYEAYCFWSHIQIYPDWLSINKLVYSWWEPVSVLSAHQVPHPFLYSFACVCGYWNYFQEHTSSPFQVERKLLAFCFVHLSTSSGTGLKSFSVGKCR